MLEPKLGCIDTPTGMVEGRVPDTSGSPGSGPREQVIGAAVNNGAAPDSPVTASHVKLTSECLICRYRKRARRTGESANA